MNLWLMQIIYVLGGIFILPLMPFLHLQGLRTRRKIGVLPNAAGDVRGKFFGASEEIVKLLALGESTVAGLGARTHETALAGQFARVLSNRVGKSVEWLAIGKNGLTAEKVSSELVPQIPEGEKFDYIVLGIGGNDVLKLSSPLKWRRTTINLLKTLRELHPESVIFITNVAAVKLTTVLPQPIKFILSAVSYLHNRNIKDFIREFQGVYYYETPDYVPPDFFADGLHPSEAGYRTWSEEIIKTWNK